MKTTRLFAPAAAALLAACAITPDGPSLMALPGTGRTYEQFLGDDVLCKQAGSFAAGGITPNQAAAQSGLASAAAGAALGAAAGAAMGGGQGAAVGSGVGLAAGGMAGAAAAQSSSRSLQERYDQAYIQCMYAKGHRVPVWGSFTEQRAAPPAPAIPPPPPNQPPPAATRGR